MSMIYIGNRTYFDTDLLDNENYADFCKYRDNLRKYYKFWFDSKAKAKAMMIGINIDEIMRETVGFFKELFAGYDLDVLSVIQCIAYDTEEKIYDKRA